MMENDDSTPQRELTSLLHRALRSVDRVRLDKVESIIESFQDAVDMLEANLQPDSPMAGADTGNKTLPDPLPADAIDFKPQALKALPNNLRNAATVDYSSPRLGRRQLGGRGPKKSGLGKDGGLGAGLGGLGGLLHRDSAAKPKLEAKEPPLKAVNPLLQRAGGGAGAGMVTQDYSSPRLGSRSIGGKRGPSAKNDLFSKPEPLADKPASKGRAAELAADEPTSTIQGEAPKGVMGSPKQMMSSKLLVKLAGNPKEKRVESPKPQYLRRLDSPNTHNKMLVDHKKRLTKLLERALGNVNNMDVAKYDKIRGMFEVAVRKLEAGCVRNHDSP